MGAVGRLCGRAAEGGKDGAEGQAVWEQRKWEKQDSLEDWARQGSPGTTGPAQGREQGEGRQEEAGREMRQGEAKLGVVQVPRLLQLQTQNPGRSLDF